jgi:hypothetical protein
MEQATGITVMRRAIPGPIVRDPPRDPLSSWRSRISELKRESSGTADTGGQARGFD